MHYYVGCDVGFDTDNGEYCDRLRSKLLPSHQIIQIRILLLPLS